MLNCLSVKLSLITLVAASVVYSYSYQVVKSDFQLNTEFGKKKHHSNNPQKRDNQKYQLVTPHQKRRINPATVKEKGKRKNVTKHRSTTEK